MVCAAHVMTMLPLLIYMRAKSTASRKIFTKASHVNPALNEWNAENRMDDIMTAAGVLKIFFILGIMNPLNMISSDAP